MAAQIDPVTLEVARNALPAIASEMAADVQRTSYNMMIYEVRDFCTALVAPDGALISQNVGGVSHFIADLGAIVKDAMKRYGREGFAAGDVVITNHQAVAGQHLNNVAIYMPYFFRGELLMFSIVRAHWIDIGGMSTGFGGEARILDPWMEGLQLDQLKIYEAGRVNETLLKVIRDNIRFPDASLGDMRSQMAACRLSFRRLDELFEKFGRDTILEAIQRIFGETETKCRKVVSQMPDGVYQAESFLDSDGLLRNERVRIHAKVTIAQGKMTIDLSGCSPERKAGIEFPHACRSAGGLQNFHLAARSFQRRLVRRARRDHPRRQHHDGALSRAHVRLEPDCPYRGRHHSHCARSRHSRQNSRRAPRPSRRSRRFLRRESKNA